MKKITFILIAASLLATGVSAKDDALVDARDKQSYPVVTIDGKKWMAKNLNYAGINGEIGTCERKSYHHPTKTVDCNAYGRIYTWAETRMMPACTRKFCLDGTNNCNTCVGGFCPRGWRLPSKAELEKLIAFAGGNETAGKKLRAKEGWAQYGRRDSSGTNNYGFSALPAGKSPESPSFSCDPPDPMAVCSAPVSDGNFGATAWWWSSTESDSENAYSLHIGSRSDVNNVSVKNYDKSHKMSVRCLEGE